MRGTDEITNSADIIDSRNVIERIAYLEAERDEDGNKTQENESGTEVSKAQWAEDNKPDADELRALLALQEEAEGYSDWTHGAGLIRDSYFEDYARDMAEDIGAIDRNATWPLNHIDWPAAADALKQDYTSVDFDGVEYWVRS